MGNTFTWYLFLASPHGGDVEKICDFQEWKIRSHGSNVLASPLGGDVEEIGNFQGRKIRSHGTIFLASWEISNAWLENLYQGYLNENCNF